ncbi:electron transfer flavoprotein subunit alpha [Legionella adelaidensis]|uniref:Electron transfer flavoprotein subunit alpha n=1 Tax=Legionella adelaidensis TaxID=45056 RepID=A0A0W0R413_9GAMM|nr:FAD-binding protein [Legionella adelaidensis]KTC65785.1 electron transfer flavoprotein subunit alpha [Legionella adelaidensis]
MSVLIIVEHDNKTMQAATRNILTAALQLDKEPILLVAGYQCQQIAAEAATLEGAHAVWHVDDIAYEHATAEIFSKLIVEIGSSCTYIIGAASTFGKNILPRVAALLDVAQVSDVVRIVNANTFEHPIYAGNALEEVSVLDNQMVLSIRPTAFEPVINKQAACCVENINKSIIDTRVKFVKHELSKSQRPDLGSAKIVVSGGRGLQNAEKFKLVEELADTLGAAIGASRAAVDAGFVSNEYQVGQTGRIVAPTLYFAIGISGAVQHLAGMKDSKVIVAINKDPDAPIFQIATYGLVGDLFEIIPELIHELNKSI